MANQLYPKAKQAFLSGMINIPSDNLRVILVDTGNYTYSSSHQYLTDVPTLARVATSGFMASKSVTNGIFDAADTTFTSVTGVDCEAIIVYQDTGIPATSQLICYFDTGVSGLPAQPAGGDITLQWSGSGVFSL